MAPWQLLSSPAPLEQLLSKHSTEEPQACARELGSMQCWSEILHFSSSASPLLLLHLLIATGYLAKLHTCCFTEHLPNSSLWRPSEISFFHIIPVTAVLGASFYPDQSSRALQGWPFRAVPTRCARPGSTAQGVPVAFPGGTRAAAAPVGSLAATRPHVPPASWQPDQGCSGVLQMSQGVWLWQGEEAVWYPVFAKAALGLNLPFPSLSIVCPLLQ